MNYQPTSRYTTFLPGSYTGGGYTNPYQKDLDAILKRTQDGSAYRKQYLREADRTMQDTLAQYGSMTGGIPSTQAVAAASQAADYYKSQLADKMADLDYQNANLLLAAGNQAASDYQLRISDAMNRWSQLGYADDEVAQILGVAIGTPTSDQSYQSWQRGMQENQWEWQKDMQERSFAREGEQWDWERQQQAKSDAYTLAMALLQAGQMPGADTLAASGISQEDANALLSAVQASQASRASGGGGSGGGSSGSSGKIPKLSELEGLLEKYSTGGWDAVNGDMLYYEQAGYDTDWIGTWLMQSGYGSGDMPSGGYTGAPSTGYGGTDAWWKKGIRSAGT